jgi:homoaconitase/3-isopropylmalate dehydratase large subunit
MNVAGAIGARFVRPGAGAPAAVHRRRFAAPGRTLAASAPGIEGAGAFAMLALRAEAIELAAALAGEPLVRARPAVVGVRVEGAPRTGVGGAEIVTALAAQLQGRARGAVLEFHGPGLAALPMAERIAISSLAPSRTLAAGVVFPSDDLTRVYLRARGRDAEWRRAEGLAEDFELAVGLALDSILPVPMTVTRARVSALAEDEDVVALALALSGQRAGVPLEVVFGGRAARASLEREGVPAILAEAGATLLDPDAPEAHLGWTEGVRWARTRAERRRRT